ncbi:MAG: hypothetical protein KatS3mg024_2171 [Armatimonadota bacterium]|nr:MAG: hypothetical protein KatS3mg024_2171 [Armatimonadota bacterium]
MIRKSTLIFAIMALAALATASAHASVLDPSTLPFPVEGAEGMTMDQMDAVVLATYNSGNGFTVLFPTGSSGSGGGTAPASLSLSSFGQGAGLPPAPPTFAGFSSLPAGGVSPSIAPMVPEPASLLVLAAGAGTLVFKRKR